MKIARKSKVDPNFSVASMTDMIFLLLIFFLLTSNFITPSGHPVNLPKSNSAKIVLQKITVTMTKDLELYVNDKKTVMDNLEAELKSLKNSEEDLVVLHVDETVDHKYFVQMLDRATRAGMKISVAADPGN